MEKEKIKVRVFEMTAYLLNIEETEIKEETKFINDLDADSLDLVELVMELEKEFDIKINDTDAEKVITMLDLVNLVDKEVNKN